jgi:ELWxxDGT repeat protein
VRVKDINPGVANASPIGVPFRGGYLFAADHARYGRELWFSDGTEEGTRLVKDINPGAPLSTPLDFAVVGGTAWFATIRQAGANDQTVVTELWRTDGTTDGTVRVWRAPGRFNGYAIKDLTVSGNHLFFAAPTAQDANGISADFEPHAIQLRRERGVPADIQADVP